MENLKPDVLKKKIDLFKENNPGLFKHTVSDEDSITPYYLSKIENPDDIYDNGFCYPQNYDVENILYEVLKELNISYTDLNDDLKHELRSYICDIMEITEDDAWKDKKKFKITLFPYQFKNLNTMGSYTGDALSYLGRTLCYDEIYDDAVIKKDHPIRKIMKSEGYELGDLFSKKNSSGNSSFLNELEEGLTDIYERGVDDVFIGIPLKVSFNDYFKLKSGEYNIETGKRTPLILYAPFSGSGADDSAVMEKPLYITVSMEDDPMYKSKKTPDAVISFDDDPSFGYSVGEIYDFYDEVWDTDYRLIPRNNKKIVWL